MTPSEAALTAAPSSPYSNSDAYFGLLVRPLDPASARAYYASRGLSTCALTVLAAYRLAGCTDMECAAPYYPGRVGKAFSDVQALAMRHGAWEPAVSVTAPLRAGDAWVITRPDGSDGHMGLCVADESSLEGAISTVEGGQDDGHGGSSAIGRFTRHLVRTPGGIFMGARRIYGVVRADRLPLVDPSFAPDTAAGDRTTV